MKRKKILIYGITSTVGGIETYLINLLKNIDSNIFEVDLLMKENLYKKEVPDIKGYYNRLYVVPNFLKHPIKAIQFLKKISKNNKYDVVHFNICLASSCVYAIPFKIFSKAKIFVHSHNSNDKRKIRHYLFRPLLNKIADKKIACSELASIWMYGKKETKNNKTILLNNFIDTDKFLYNPETRLNLRNKLNLENKFVIGHIGRFNYQKNHHKIIEIFSETLKKHRDIILILIGTGELEDEIKKYVKDLNIEENVKFLGLIDNVYEYYQVMDLFILPSIFEGLPIVGIEAQASGLKCLFSDTIDKNSDISGNVEFITLNNIDLWKKNIEKIMKSNYKRENMKKIIINSGYDLKTEIKKIEEMYIGE